MPIDLVAGMALTKTALDLVKGVREAIRQNKKFTEDEMKDYLETLQDKLVDVKTALADADDERRALLGQIEELKRMADFGAEFKLEEGVYWRANAPYCPICWDVDRRPVRLGGPLNTSKAGLAGQFGWECALHKVEFAISRARTRPGQAPNI